MILNFKILSDFRSPYLSSIFSSQDKNSLPLQILFSQTRMFSSKPILSASEIVNCEQKKKTKLYYQPEIEIGTLE